MAQWALALVIADIFPMSFFFNQMFTTLRVAREKSPGVAVVYDELSRRNFEHQYKENLTFDPHKDCSDIVKARLEQAEAVLKARREKLQQHRTELDSKGQGFKGKGSEAFGKGKQKVSPGQGHASSKGQMYWSSGKGQGQYGHGAGQFGLGGKGGDWHQNVSRGSDWNSGQGGRARSRSPRGYQKQGAGKDTRGQRHAGRGSDFQGSRPGFLGW